MTSETTQDPARPLSPHLQIYKWQMPMTTSILHRMTGCALAIGTLMVVWMLASAACGPEAYSVFTGFAGSIIGRLMLFGWTVALYYHLCNGIRHLTWDTVHLFKIEQAYLAGYAVFAGTIILTILTWWSVLS